MLYKPPVFVSGELPERPRSYVRVFVSFSRVVEISPQQSSLRIDNADDVPLEEFLKLYEPLRNALAYRRLQGEALSPREHVVLTKLNQLLSTWLEHPQPEPPAVTQAVEEAKLLLHQLENG
jgi:hypothetical protein